MSGGQFSVPLVIRMATGAGRQLAAQHSHSTENWYAHIPGIRVLAPATVGDARAACWPRRWPIPIRSSSSSMPSSITWKTSWATTGVVTSPVPPCAAQAREVSVFAYGGCLPKAMQAAAELADAGIDVEVVDLRVLRPLDSETIAASVRKTHRAVVVDEGWKSGSLAAEVVARIVEDCFYELDAPPVRVCSAPKCRSPTPGTWRRRHCHKRQKSSRR